jgi:radical SAM superfamily enzyme YgiQ (UPF0313 family)
MRVLLVRPQVPPHTIGLKHLMACEPLELEYVAAGLAGHEVEILDLLVERGFERRLRRFRPDVVGTGSYITGVNEVKKLCRAAKRWNPRVRTVVGGVHASVAPEDFADAAVDCIALGDGTTLMPELLGTLARGEPLEGVAGLALPVSGGVRRTAPRPYMGDPDRLPMPRRDLVAHLAHRYYYLFHRPVALLKTTWGCWYDCNFCFTWRITDGKVYARSPESIVDELAAIGAEDVYVVDDIFLIHRDRLARIAALLRARGIRKKFLCFARADFVAQNEDVIAEWAGLGLSAVLIGLEAPTQGELDAMAKRTTVDHNHRAVEVLRRHGVDPYASLIPGPDYGPEDWARLRRYIEDLGLYYLNISPLTPLPGTAIWDRHKDVLTVRRSAHGLWDLSHAVVPTRMPLKAYYRELFRTYAGATLDMRRASRLSLRTRPPLLSRAYLRVWWGAIRVGIQLLGAHRHHAARAIAKAEYAGPALAAGSSP